MPSRAAADNVRQGRPADIAETISAAAIRASYREDDLAAWDQTLSGLHYAPVSYSSASIDYQLAYQRGLGGQWCDVSLVLHHDDRPCGVWPLSLSVKADNASVTSHGFPVLPPLFVKGLPDRSRKSLVKGCLKLLEALCCTRRIAGWESAESFGGQPESGLSEWHQQSMFLGAKVFLRHELFVDLSLEIEAIKTRFRKSYKSLIVSGTRIWQVGVIAGKDPAAWEEFQRLHLNVAGRVTRSAETWELHHQAIIDGNALLVFLRNNRADMVGAGFFNITRDEGVYGVGAYDRSLFDKPLGHVVQYRAIEEMKKRGLRWYRIGFRTYPCELPTPTEKEISIGQFKQGFATHLFPQYVLRHDVLSVGVH